MCFSSVLRVSLCLLMCLPSCRSPDVKVKPGDDATLQCHGPRDADITLLKWSRSDLQSDHYVFFYREKRPYPQYQHPSYRGRVELKDPQMKNGDVSVVLKNVNTTDAGTYQCYVGDTGGDRLIGTNDLKVQSGGVKNTHAGAGLAVCLTAALVVAFTVC